MPPTPTSPLTGTEPGPAPGVPDPVAAREAMVARLAPAGQLWPGPVHEALLGLRREFLIPQAHVRRTAPGVEPPCRDLLDWAAPTDRAELLDVLYGGASVLVQHDGEPLLGRGRGERAGGMISSMSSVTGMTAELLQELDRRPGQRVLDVGTGSGVTAAAACHTCEDAGVVTLDRDRHLVDAAAVRLADVGFRPHVVCGAGEEAMRDHGPFDRIFVSYSVQQSPRTQPGTQTDQPSSAIREPITKTDPGWEQLSAIGMRWL